MRNSRSHARVGVIFERGGTWDQVGPALAAGFATNGAEVTLIGAGYGWLGTRLHNLSSRVRPLPRGGWPLLQMQNIRARRALRRVAPVDFWVQLGSTLPYLRPSPYVTFEDMTVTLAAGDETFTLAKRTERSWLLRQQRTYAGAARCYAASDWAAESIRRDFRVAPEKVCVLGIAHDLIVADAPALKDWQRPTFLWVGSNWERKNGERVLAAFREIRAECPDATLHLVGEHPEVNAEGVTGHGYLARSNAAQTAELTALFEAATCFVMPSKHEPWGIVYVEAQAHGVPCIGTTVGGAATAIGDGGICVDPGDQAALTAAMRQMCSPQTARAFGERALLHSRPFTWPQITRQILEDLSPIATTSRLTGAVAP